MADGQGQPGLRFAGQEGALSIVDSTTGEALLGDMALESVNITLMMEQTEKSFIGALANTFREFLKGAEVKFKFEHNNADQSVDFINRLVAKAQGLSTDEFALSFTVASPSGGKLQFILRNLSFGDIPFDLGSRTDFAESEIDAKCSVFLCKSV